MSLFPPQTLHELPRTEPRLLTSYSVVDPDQGSQVHCTTGGSKGRSRKETGSHTLHVTEVAVLGAHNEIGMCRAWENG